MTVSVEAPPVKGIIVKRLPKNRIALWDNLKFFLIVCVVIGHIVDYSTKTESLSRAIYLYLYSFHMPLFIFISGLFFNYKNVSNKVCLFIIYGILLKIVIFSSNFICSSYIPKFSTFSDAEIPWFLFALAAYYTLAVLLKDLNKFFLLIFSIIFACYVGYDKSIRDFLYLSRIIIFFPFFWLGLILSSNNIIEYKVNKKTLKIFIALFIVISFAILCINHIDVLYRLRGFFTGRNPFPQTLLDFGPLIRIVCYGISLLMCWALIILTPNKTIPFITLWGSRTLHVYFWHKPLMIVLLCFIPISIINSTPLGILGSIAVGLVIAWITSLKVFTYPLDWVKHLLLQTANKNI